MKPVTAYEYPPVPHVRRHGPFGYTDYCSYRDWLRDDFAFRCVFCLYRETWGPTRGRFHIDHHEPQSQAPLRVCDYDNLLYVCGACNSAKRDLVVPNPCEVSFADCLRVLPTGKIEALNETGEELQELLSLNEPSAVEWRGKLLTVLQRFIEMAPEEYLEWVRFPSQLPDLSNREPKGNTRPGGVNDSWYAKKMRGELPAEY